MNLYAISLAIGSVGFLAMALTGLGRHGHTHERGPARGHGPGPGHGHAHGGPRHGRGPGVSWLWSLTSPRVLFSLFIGFGTTGLAIRSALSRSLTLVAAVAGGLLFEQLLV